MCVICYVPENTYLPKKSTIKAMWDKNPHGAGVMYKNANNEVFYKKGYFDFDEFYEELVEISKRAVEMAIHCRIATSGGINQEMCHPFNLTSDVEEIKEHSGYKCDKPIVMHNGVISIEPKYDLNYTCTYIIDTLVPIYKNDPTFMFNQNTIMDIEDEIGSSKLLIMSIYPTKMIGHWKKDDDGCYYSNLYFKPYDYTRYDYSRYFTNRKTAKTKIVYGRNSNGYLTKYEVADDNCLISRDDD